MPSSKRLTLDLAREYLGDRPSDAGHRRVIEGIEDRQPISQDAHELAGREDSFGDRLADSVARVGGSWLFIGLFFLFLVGWTGLNTIVLSSSEAFDPYPYIFLNLILSMLAAIQAPVIMMSQNRQAEKDRIAAAHDYEVNLRSEIEIMAMQQKLDKLRGEQHETIIAQQEELLKLVRQLSARP
ncbi:DUF1003 domain-containing protein [Erythrobacter sp. SDW2]|uniref:DUF1003 domain-containing protein n=1 Tax=Erythrobacter sp. SDW2 TaxID=2907154 RepID=UPI001F34EBBA|nr:DUF1003 domain-containing protein [Erythrobacter sp. SDW2]UIP08126.1 DUF1003 domain-containing protein [Erythrobacter sp. SDW2]